MWLKGFEELPVLILLYLFIFLQHVDSQKWLLILIIKEPLNVVFAPLVLMW